MVKLKTKLSNSDYSIETKLIVKVSRLNIVVLCGYRGSGHHWKTNSIVFVHIDQYTYSSKMSANVTYYRILLFAINMIIYCICTVVLRSYCICNSEIKHNTLASRNESITRQGYSSAANKATSVLASQDANLVSQNADAGQS